MHIPSANFQFIYYLQWFVPVSTIYCASFSDFFIEFSAFKDYINNLVVSIIPMWRDIYKFKQKVSLKKKEKNKINGFCGLW